MENIPRSVGEQFIFDTCHKNPKCKSFTETIKWMVTFAYILDGLSINTEICLYTCYNIIEGLKITRIKKGCISNKDIAIIACSIYSFVKEEGLIVDFVKQFSGVLDKVLDKVNNKFNYVNDYLKDESIQDLELILMTDD